MDKKIVNILESLKMFISNNTFLLLKESLMLNKRYVIDFIKIFLIFILTFMLLGVYIKCFSGVLYANEISRIKFGYIKYLLANRNEYGNCLYAIKFLKQDGLFIPVGESNFAKSDGVILSHPYNKFSSIIQMKHYNGELLDDEVIKNNIWKWNRLCLDNKYNCLLVDTVYNNIFNDFIKEGKFFNVSNKLIIHNSNDLVQSETDVNILQESINKNNKDLKSKLIEFGMENVFKKEEELDGLWEEYNIKEIKKMSKGSIKCDNSIQNSARKHLMFRENLKKGVESYLESIKNN